MAAITHKTIDYHSCMLHFVQPLFLSLILPPFSCLEDKRDSEVSRKSDMKIEECGMIRDAIIYDTIPYHGKGHDAILSTPYKMLYCATMLDGITG